MKSDNIIRAIKRRRFEMKRHNVLILAMLFIVMAIAVSCKSEPQTQPLSEDDKALIGSVVENVTQPDSSSGPVISAKSFITYTKEDLNNALKDPGMKVGDDITIKGSVTDVPVVKLEIDLANFTPAEGDRNLASVVIVIGDDPSIEDPNKIYKIEARDKSGDPISAGELVDIVNSDEFTYYILNNLKNGISINGSNIEVSLNANPAFDGKVPKSLDAKLSIKMKNPMGVGEFKYSGSAEAVLNATFKPDSEIAAVVADSLSIKVSFNLNIYDGAKNHTVSGMLNIAFPDLGNAKFTPSFSLSSFSIDGRAINGDDALKYIISKIIVK